MFSAARTRFPVSSSTKAVVAPVSVEETRFRARLRRVTVLLLRSALAIASTPAEPRLLSGRSRIATIVFVRRPAAGGQGGGRCASGLLSTCSCVQFVLVLSWHIESRSEIRSCALEME